MRLAALAVVACSVAALTAPSARADPIPPDATWREVYIRSGDGTRLHADVFRPKGLARGEKTPVIVIVSPYIGIGGAEGGLLERPQILDYYRDLFDRAFRRGYSIVQVALRGQGASDGCPDVGGPGEQADAAAAVRWSATRRWSTGKVASWGLSWDGYTQVMNLANGTRGLKAAVISSPVTDLYRGHFMNGVAYLRAGVVLGGYYHYLAAIPPLPSEEALLPQLAETIAAAGDPECAPELLSHMHEEAEPDPDTDFWRERDLIDAAGESDVPVLFSQGFLDEQTYGDQFLPLWRRLQGPKRAWFGQFAHVVASEAENGHPTVVGRRGFTAEAFRWLDTYVKGKRGAAVRRDPPVEVQEGSQGWWRSERRWPPRDARRVEVPLRPAPYFDGPGSKAETFCTRIELHCVPGVPGVLGAWTLTQPLPYPAHFAGVPRLSAEVSSPAAGPHLVAFVYDIDSENRVRYVTKGASVARPGATTSFNLYPQDWRFETGHRIGVFISGADDEWFVPGLSLTPVSVVEGAISLPFLRRERVSNLAGGPSDAVRNRSWFPFPEGFIEPFSVKSPLPPPMRRQR